MRLAVVGLHLPQGSHRKAKLSRDPYPAIKARRDSSETGDVFSEGIAHENAGIFDIDPVGKLRVAVATHQEEVVGCYRVEILVVDSISILEARRDEPFSLPLRHIELYSKTTDAHDRSAEDAFDLSAA